MNLMQKRFNEQMQDPDPYNRAFVAMTGRDKYFKNPVIHEHDMRHEELLGVYPEDQCSLVEKICL